MAVQYDLIVIGSSPAGIFAATVAAGFKARVALVEQSVNYSYYGASDAIINRCISQNLRLVKQWESKNGKIPDSRSQIGWAEEVLLTLAELDSQAVFGIIRS